MKTITGNITSTAPVSLSDAAAILSDFAATETGASDAVSAYIRRATDAFNQLVQFHNDLLSPNSGSKRHRKEQSRTHEVIAKEEEESVKVEQSPAVKHHNEKKHKKEGIEPIRDLNVINEGSVKTDPYSVSIEDRKNTTYGAEKVKNENGEELLGDGKYQENKHEKVKTESSLKSEHDEAEGDSMKKKDKKKKKKRKKSSESNEGVAEENLGFETKKRKSGEIDGGLASGSSEQSSKRKSKKQRVEGK